MKQLYRHPQWTKPSWPSADDWAASAKRIEMLKKRIDQLLPDERHAIDLFINALTDKALEVALIDTEVTRKEWFENAPEGFLHYYTD